MEFANMEKVIEELQKVAINTNKAVTVKMEEQANLYDEKIAELNRLATNQNDIIKESKETIERQIEILQKANIEIKEQEKTIEELKKEVAALREELKKTNDKIILSTDNQNKAGRPPLTDEEIRLIREGLANGFSMRKTAEFADVSLGSVSNYSKELKEKAEKEKQLEVFKNNKNEQEQQTRKRFLDLEECIEKSQFCDGSFIGSYAFFELGKAYNGNSEHFTEVTNPKNYQIAVKEVNKRIQETGKTAKECIADMVQFTKIKQSGNSSKI